LRRAFKVVVDVPEETSMPEMRQYIENAVNGWKGGFHPDDPLFYLPPAEVTYRKKKE
jgi:hypothetical protein